MTTSRDLVPKMASIAYALIERSYKADKNFREHCTLETCPLSLSYWAYRPSLAANSFFLAIFGLSTSLFLVQAVLSKRFLGFTIAMVSGCALEVIGYVGRIMSYYNPFSEVSITSPTALLLCHRIPNFPSKPPSYLPQLTHR